LAGRFSAGSTTGWRRPAERSTATTAHAKLLNVAVSHAGDVIGDGAGESLRGYFCLVVVGQQRGVAEEGGEDLLDDLAGVAMDAFHSGGVVEILVEKVLGDSALGFDGRAERGETRGRAADVVETGCAERENAGAGFRDEVRDEKVEQAGQGLIRKEARLRGRGCGCGLIEESTKERDTIADLGEREDAGIEAVVEVGGEVGDFVGEVDELGFEGRELIEEVVGELGVVGCGVIARVLDDAFAQAESEVEAAESGVALLEPGDDAQGVEVVVKGEAVVAEGAVEGLFAGVAKGRMADVVGEGEGFGELGIEAEGAGKGACNLDDLERMREAAAEVVAGWIAGQAGEDLGFAGEAAKCARVENAGGVAGKGRAVRVRRLRECALCERAGGVDGDAGRQRGNRVGGGGHPFEIIPQNQHVSPLVIPQEEGRRFSARPGIPPKACWQTSVRRR
jgi:hypothetical protein